MKKLSDRQLKVLRTTVSEGSFTESDTNDRIAANALDALRLIERDLKRSYVWHPNDAGRAYIVALNEPVGEAPLATGKFQLLPPLSAQDFETLEKSIRDKGVLVPVEYDEEGNILDGHHRVAICEKLGLTDWPRFVRKGMRDDDEKRAYAREINISRRHMNTEQKRVVIEAQLKETPQLSSRVVAGKLGVHHTTVESARKQLLSTGEISQLEKTTGADGRSRKRPLQTMFLPDKVNIREHKKVSKAIRRSEQVASHANRLSLAAAIAENSDAAPWWGKGGQEGAAYSVIYADPPWKFITHSEVTGGEKSAENHYPTMTLDDICDLGCPAAKQAVLYMWITDLKSGIRAMEAWGFEYKSFWVWKKIYPGEQHGTGYWSFDNAELLIIGTRGGFPAPLPGTQPVKCMDHPVGAHSAKPVWYAQELDRLYPDLPKLEMFQRRASLADGDIRLSGKWEFWGNQASTAESEAA